MALLRRRFRTRSSAVRYIEALAPVSSEALRPCILTIVAELDSDQRREPEHNGKLQYHLIS